MIEFLSEVGKVEQLIYTLLAYINNSINKDINYYIAKSLLEHIHKIESFSLDSVAEACNVAPSTINRFCKRIGFKHHFQQMLKLPLRDIGLFLSYSHGLTLRAYTMG